MFFEQLVVQAQLQMGQMEGQMKHLFPSPLQHTPVAKPSAHYCRNQPDPLLSIKTF